MPHSPTPWLRFDEEGYSWIGVAVHGETGATEIAKVYDRDDAKLILTAVNCHAKLLAALRELLSDYKWHRPQGGTHPMLGGRRADDLEAMAKSAIAEAEGGTTS